MNKVYSDRLRFQKSPQKESVETDNGPFVNGPLYS